MGFSVGQQTGVEAGVAVAGGGGVGGGGDRVVQHFGRVLAQQFVEAVAVAGGIAVQQTLAQQGCQLAR